MARKKSGQVVVDFQAKTAQFNTAINRLDKRMQGMQRTMAMATKVVGAFGVALSGMAAVRGLGRVIDDIDRIGKLSTRLGVSTEALSELGHAAKLSGLEFNTMTMAMQRMTRRVAEAAAGTGEAKAAIAEMGLSAQALANLKPEKQLEIFADALSGVKNESDQVRLAMKLFDSEGVAMLQMLKGGSDVIREHRQAANRLGLTYSKDMTEAAAEAKNEMERLGAQFDAFGIIIATNVIPPLTKLLQIINDLFGGRDVAEHLSTMISSIDQEIKGLEHSLRLKDRVAATGNRALMAQVEEYESELTRLTAQKSALEAGLKQLQTEAASAAGAQGGAGAGAASPFALTESSRGPRAAEEASMAALEKEREAAQKFLELERQKILQARMLREEDLRSRLDMMDIQFLAEQERLQEQFAIADTTAEDRRAFELAMLQEHEGAKAEIIAQHQQERLQREQDMQNQIVSMQRNAIDGIVGLLGQLGAKHKGFAIAAILVNKAQAMAETIQNTAAGIMKAYTIDPTGALAAKVALMGKIQMGIIAATGALQIGQAASGGGTSSTTIGTNGQVASQFTTNGNQRVVNINLGDEDALISVKAVRKFLEGPVAEALGDGIRIQGVPA